MATASIVSYGCSDDARGLVACLELLDWASCPLARVAFIILEFCKCITGTTACEMVGKQGLRGRMQLIEQGFLQRKKRDRCKSVCKVPGARYV